MNILIKTWILPTLLSLILLSGCGVKGALYHPKKEKSQTQNKSPNTVKYKENNQ